jgi:hypothetical protein
MPTPFLPHTFDRGGYKVTVERDRSIKVKEGDWLSKYAIAIYGHYSKELIKLFRCVIDGRYADIPNPDLIKTGDTLYHPARLPDEPESATDPLVPGPPFQTERVWDFLRTIKQEFETSVWRAEPENGGGDPCIRVGHRIRFTKTNGAANVLFKIDYLNPSMCPYERCEGEPRSLRMHDFGTVLRLQGVPLGKEDRRSHFLLMDFGRNLCHSTRGRPVSLLVFGGVKNLWNDIAFARGLVTYFRFGNPSNYRGFLFGASGVMVTAPPGHRELPDYGFAASTGYMYVENR